MTRVLLVLTDGARRCHARVIEVTARRVVVDVVGIRVVFSARTGRFLGPRTCRRALRGYHLPVIRPNPPDGTEGGGAGEDTAA